MPLATDPVEPAGPLTAFLSPGPTLPGGTIPRLILVPPTPPLAPTTAPVLEFGKKRLVWGGSQGFYKEFSPGWKGTRLNSF